MTVVSTRQLRPAAMSIDVEDWFHVENLKRAIPRESWDELEPRVERNTDRLLELLDHHDVRCTCFVLGWVAERCPALVRRIAAAGHEVGSHGYAHDLLPSIGPERFRDDVRRSKLLLEDITGTEVQGYRAPSFSITDWALPILAELGFRYDSSLFPAVGNSRYGALPAMDATTGVAEALPGLYEIPISVLRVKSFGLPWGGGGYFRLLPYGLFRWGVRRALGGEVPYVFYVHPWEIDPGQPRVEGPSRFGSFRHYVGLGSAERRLSRLLEDFSWDTVGSLLPPVQP